MKCIIQVFAPKAETVGGKVDEFLRPLMSPPIEFTSKELLAMSVSLAQFQRQGASAGSPAGSAMMKVDAVIASWKKHVRENS